MKKLPKDGTIRGVFQGYDFVIRRTEMGHLCGYVKIDGFKNVNFEYGDIYMECHGGITFDGASKILSKDVRKYRWIGFDCGHCGDWSLNWQYGEYKNTDFVLLEIKKIIEQLIELGE